MDITEALRRGKHLEVAGSSLASPVAKTVRSGNAKAKDASTLADDGLPIHSVRTLLKRLSTLTYLISHPRVDR